MRYSAALPPEQGLVATGKAIVKSITEWKAGKTFHGTMHKDTPYSVRTTSKAKEHGEEAGWHARMSEHKEATFDEFWDKLGRNKAVNEKE